MTMRVSWQNQLKFTKSTRGEQFDPSWAKRLEKVRDQVQAVSRLMQPLDGLDSDLDSSAGSVVVAPKDEVVKELVKQVYPEASNCEEVSGRASFDLKDGSLKSLDCQIGETTLTYRKEKRWLLADKEHFSWSQVQQPREPDQPAHRPVTIMGDLFPASLPAYPTGLKVELTVQEGSDRFEVLTSNLSPTIQPSPRPAPSAYPVSRRTVQYGSGTCMDLAIL